MVRGVRRNERINEINKGGRTKVILGN